MSERPDLRELVGDDVGGAELEALERVDGLLRITQAPPAEVPSTLTASVRAIPETRHGSRRRLLGALALAAALAAVAFGVGVWAAGDGDGGPEVVDRIVLEPLPGAPDAEMRIDVLPVDEAGNWPMLADVRGLEPLPEDGYYELWLTEGDELAASCGRFVVDADGSADNVWLNGPYAFESYDRWVVTAHLPGTAEEPWLLDGPVVTPA
jgi:hypothetical protein